MSNYVFISGAAGGLGKAFAVECASRGWNLFLTDLNASQLENLASGLARTYRVNTLAQVCDLTAPQERSALFNFIHARELKFHLLINVAGVDYEGLFSQLSRPEIHTIIRLNIEATLDVTHALLDCASPGQPLTIINVSSLAAYYPMPIKATYAASKRFLLDFSIALRNELKEMGARVTVLCPAGLPTTPGSLAGIAAQGWIGHLTTCDIGRVATLTIDRALRGQAVVIPGRINQILQLLGGLVPPVSLAGMIGSRWRAAQTKRAELACKTA